MIGGNNSVNALVQHIRRLEAIILTVGIKPRIFLTPTDEWKATKTLNSLNSKLAVKPVSVGLGWRRFSMSPQRLD